MIQGIIDQKLKYSFAAVLLVPLIIWLISGPMDALALFSGIVWGGVNLYLIAVIVECLLVSKRYMTAALMLALKFPLLYGAGYLLLTVQGWNLWFLLAGPPLAFIVVLATVLWGYSVRSA